MAAPPVLTPYLVSGPAAGSDATAPSTNRKKHALPPLPYGYEALEPHISREIMKIHHSGHHQTYVTNLNKAEDQLLAAYQKGDAAAVVYISRAFKFNGGGHINHSLFWENLSPASSPNAKPPAPDSQLGQLIKRDYGSLDSLKEAVNKALLSIEGSGWSWLTWSPNLKRLVIDITRDQDPVVDNIPLLGIDFWEHAYYLQYHNAKAEYAKAIWNVVNWDTVAKRLEKATQESTKL